MQSKPSDRSTQLVQPKTGRLDEYTSVQCPANLVTGAPAAASVGALRGQQGPDFETKAADIVGLYLELPQHAALFGVEEKTAIQALDRLDPVLPLSPARAERHTRADCQGDAPEGVLREQVAMARLNEGITLDTMNRTEEAMAAYGKLLHHFWEDPNPR